MMTLFSSCEISCKSGFSSTPSGERLIPSPPVYMHKVERRLSESKHNEQQGRMERTKDVLFGTKVSTQSSDSGWRPLRVRR